MRTVLCGIGLGECGVPEGAQWVGGKEDELAALRPSVKPVLLAGGAHDYTPVAFAEIGRHHAFDRWQLRRSERRLIGTGAFWVATLFAIAEGTAARLLSSAYVLLGDTANRRRCRREDRRRS